MDKNLEKVYIIMDLSEVLESVYYTNESKVSKRVEWLNEATKSKRFWYKTFLEIGNHIEEKSDIKAKEVNVMEELKRKINK